MKIDALHSGAGVTVRQLKSWLADIPEVNSYTGEEYEVWIETGRNLSSPVVEICPLNLRDEGCDVLLLSRAFD